MAFKKGVVMTIRKFGSVVGALCVAGSDCVGVPCVIVVIPVCACCVRGVFGGVVVEGWCRVGVCHGLVRSAALGSAVSWGCGC